MASSADGTGMRMRTPKQSFRLNPLAWLAASFGTGLAIALPFIITIALCWMVVRFIDNSVMPLVLPALPAGLRGLANALPGAGVVIAVAILTLFGALAANVIGRFFVRQTEKLITTVPLVKGVYGSAKQIVETMSNPGGQSFKEAVLVEFPTPGIWSIAFITNDDAGEIDRALGRDVVGVYVPSCPIPTSGFLIYVERATLRPLGKGPEEALKLVMSAGIVKELPPPQA